MSQWFNYLLQVRSPEGILPSASSAGGHREDRHHHSFRDVRVPGDAFWVAECWKYVSTFDGPNLRGSALLFCLRR